MVWPTISAWSLQWCFRWQWIQKTSQLHEPAFQCHFHPEYRWHEFIPLLFSGPVADLVGSQWVTSKTNYVCTVQFISTHIKVCSCKYYRFMRQNLLLAGLWLGHSKPTMDTFPKPVMDQVRTLFDRYTLLFLTLSDGSHSVCVLLSLIIWLFS